MLDLTISALREAYLAGTQTVDAVIARVMEAVRGEDSHNAWIAVLDDTQLAPYLDRLRNADPQALPLYGIPFAIKDNIDLAGIATTAGCPDYAYVPETSAYVVQRLVDAGAVPVGKTNLDQFATGLVGARSPYGPGRNAFDPHYVSGGSSSGSAVATARGQVSFALGTDTAGSGRVPAAFNNLIGLKPTPGLLSTRGVVPACRSLDCVSVFALTAADAQAVQRIAADFDAADPYARPRQSPRLGRRAIHTRFRFGVPRGEQLAFFGNQEGERLFHRSAAQLAAIGGERIEIDFAPFLDAARLLYEGPWVSERYVAIRDFLERSPGSVYPVTREIIAGGAKPSAADAFSAAHKLQALKRRSEAVWQDLDVIVTPTAGTIYRVDEVDADPVRLNSNLGYYTNFMNLLDLSAVAVPAGFQKNGLPFGVTLFAPAFYDEELLGLADRLHRAEGEKLGATASLLADKPAPEPGTAYTTRVVVCGAHLEGLPLNHQLTERGGHLLARTRTAPCYRFYALAGGPPFRPGLLKVDAGGAAIEVEVWELPIEQFGSFVAGIPAPLGIGSVDLEDGSRVPGFICEPYALEGAEEITGLGGWRAYIARLS